MVGHRSSLRPRGADPRSSPSFVRECECRWRSRKTAVVRHGSDVCSPVSVSARTTMTGEVVALRDKHDQTSERAGNVNWKTAPRGRFALAHNRPPCASMIERQMDSPIPKPVDLVV